MHVPMRAVDLRGVLLGDAVHFGCHCSHPLPRTGTADALIRWHNRFCRAISPFPALSTILLRKVEGKGVCCGRLAE
jgi:hypothetical protein